MSDGPPPVYDRDGTYLGPDIPFPDGSLPSERFKDWPPRHPGHVEKGEDGKPCHGCGERDLEEIAQASAAMVRWRRSVEGAHAADI